MLDDFCSHFYLIISWCDIDGTQFAEGISTFLSLQFVLLLFHTSLNISLNSSNFRNKKAENIPALKRDDERCPLLVVTRPPLDVEMPQVSLPSFLCMLNLFHELT